MGRVGGYWAGKLPGNTEHEGIFPEDTEVVDIFAPPREDFLAGVCRRSA
jgi:hypothetical protein